MSVVSNGSVRLDAPIPDAVTTRVHEIACIASLVAEYFNGDANKVALWFDLANPMLGNISPRNLIRAGRQQAVLNFVMEAREGERATQSLPEEVRVAQQAQRQYAMGRDFE